MRLVHLSDLHLGFRAYARLNANGVNQREADVGRSFSRAIDATIAIAPELVIIGGDIFHAVRAPNAAIKHAFVQFTKLRAALPHTEVVMVAGNHDTPRTSETGSILGLFSALGVHVVDGPVQTLDFPALDCSVLAVADNLFARPTLAPKAGRRFNVMVLHGEAQGISPKGSPGADKELSADDLHASEWDYIGLGHYHVHREITPNCFYSGATDYTSSNIWGERAEEIANGIDGKGIVERDLVTGAQTFHALPPSRIIIDLAPLSVLDLTPEEASDAIGAAVDSIDDGIDGKVVRLVVQDIPSHVARAIDHKMLKDYARRAMHFQLDHKRPAVRSTGTVDLVRRRAPLDEIVRDLLSKRVLSSDIDRDALVVEGLRYLEDAGENKLVAFEDERNANRANIEVAA